MFKTLHRRLRVLLHRYPLLPFLLAATLAVDVILLFINSSGEGTFITKVLFGFLVSQFSLVGIWVSHRFDGLGLRLGIAVIAVATYSCFFMQLQEDIKPTFAFTMVPISIVSSITRLAISLVACLWVFRAKNFQFPSFSIKELLILCTSTAMLVYSIKQIDWGNLDLIVFAIVFGIGFSVTALVWSTRNFNRRIHLLAIFIGYVCMGLALQLEMILQNGFFYSNPVLVIRICLEEYFWLQIGIIAFTLIWSYGLQYRRRPIRQHKKKQQATPNESEQPVELKVVNQADSDEPPGPIDLTI